MNSLTPRRLHPRSIALAFVQFLLSFGRVAIILILLSLFGGGGRENRLDLIFAGLGVFAVIGAVVTYYFTTYGVQNGVLELRSGVFTRQRRSIPLNRIQNINLKRSVVHRMLGLVEVQIETASGGTEAEGKLDGLDEEQVAELRRALGSIDERGLAEDDREASAGPGVQVYQITQTELLLAGATRNRALAIIAAVVGVAVTFGQFDNLDRIVSQASENGLADAGRGTTYVFIACLLLLIGWVVSIVSTYVTYANFEVIKRGSKLVRRYGLLNLIESVVPVRRIQLFRIKQTALQRMMRYGTAEVTTAGSFGQADFSGKGLLMPLIAMRRLAGMVELVFPDQADRPPLWKRVSDRSIRSVFQVRILPSLALTAIIMAWAGREYWWMFPAFLALAFLNSYLRYRTVRYDDMGDLVASRRGVVAQQSEFVPVHKVQSITQFQSPIQRRLKLRSLTFRSASGSVRITDLPDDSGRELAESVHDRSKSSALLIDDGL